ncbi:RNA-directed DNA polymerase, eukaryota, reverse transcriptase zinc-binding domain protein [Tanacetum coccineum]
MALHWSGVGVAPLMSPRKDETNEPLLYVRWMAGPYRVEDVMRGQNDDPMTSGIRAKSDRGRPKQNHSKFIISHSMEARRSNGLIQMVDDSRCTLDLKSPERSKAKSFEGCPSLVRMTMHEVVHEMVVGECDEPNSEGSGSAWKAYMNARVASLFLLVLLEYPNGKGVDSNDMQVVMVFRDFNEVREAGERHGSNFNSRQDDIFNEFISNSSLIDIPLGGFNFTWTHKWGSKMSKLDRFLISDRFHEDFPNVTGVVLEKGIPDHRPILLKDLEFRSGRSCKILNVSFVNGLILKDQGRALQEDFCQHRDSIKILGDIDRLEANLYHLKSLWNLYVGSYVSFEQSTFIKGRNILDGPLVLNEIMAWHQKRKKDLMVFKVDFEKAFDSLRWEFLDLVMGLRQRDPLSPFLFILAMEGLHVFTCKAESVGLFKGISFGHHNMRISHFIYADDVVFLGEWSSVNAHNLLCMLRCFYLIFGLKINVNNCNVLGVELSNEEVSNLAKIIGCGDAKFPMKYLGVPVGVGGRLSLIKSVLISLPTYYMSIYMMPATIQKKLEAMREFFFIGDDLDEKNMTWVFSTWMAFGENTHSLGSFGEETNEIMDLHQDSPRIMLSERGDDVTSTKRLRRDLFGDSSRTSTRTIDGVETIISNSYYYTAEHKAKARIEMITRRNQEYCKNYVFLLIYSMARADDENPPPPPVVTPTQQAPHTVSTIKLPILKKDTNGQIKVLPPKTAEEILAREKERKARTTLLMAIPEDHLAKFHKMTNAKEMQKNNGEEYAGKQEVNHKDLPIQAQTLRYICTKLKVNSCSSSSNDRNYMPLKSDFGIDESQFTYGPKQSKTSKFDAKTSDSDSCKSNSSVETLKCVPEAVVIEPKVISQRKVWSDALIIEEYESYSDDEYVIKSSKEQETPNFAFFNTKLRHE